MLTENYRRHRAVIAIVSTTGVAISSIALSRHHRRHVCRLRPSPPPSSPPSASSSAPPSFVAVISRHHPQQRRPFVIVSTVVLFS